MSSALWLWNVTRVVAPRDHLLGRGGACPVVFYPHPATISCVCGSTREAVCLEACARSVLSQTANSDTQRSGRALLHIPASLYGSVASALTWVITCLGPAIRPPLRLLAHASLRLCTACLTKHCGCIELAAPHFASLVEAMGTSPAPGAVGDPRHSSLHARCRVASVRRQCSIHPYVVASGGAQKRLRASIGFARSSQPLRYDAEPDLIEFALPARATTFATNTLSSTPRTWHLRARDAPSTLGLALHAPRLTSLKAGPT